MPCPCQSCTTGATTALPVVFAPAAPAPEPVAVPPEAPDAVEEDEEAEPPCDICDEPPESCSCRTCTSCDERFACSEECSRCNRCSECCTHTACESCDRVVETDSICGSCNACERCCECSFCPSCSEECSGDYCGECSRCADCCSCAGEESDEDPEGEGTPPRNRGRPSWVGANDDATFHRGKTSKVNPSPRFFGLELEIATSGLNSRQEIDPEIRGWAGAALVPDGSLPDGGYEINTPPSSGDVFVQKVQSLCAALGRASATVTRECGFHVHVDARRMTYLSMRRLVRLYERVEPAMFDMVPPSRKNNRYCRRVRGGYSKAFSYASVATTAKAKADVVYAVYAVDLDSTWGRETFSRRSKSKYDDARYGAMNVHSWFYRGTVEFRLAAGTTNAVKIVNWALLCGSLLDWAEKHTDEELAGLPSDSLEALLAVAPTPDVREWVKARHDMFRYA
jgi:hypothetical protein